MEIKEMYYYEDEKRETYKETGFCEEIKEIILSYIQNYKQSDINDEKRNIINEIQKSGKSIYLVKELKKSQYEIKVENEIKEVINSEKLKDIISDIRERYIYEEALMQLSHESKLIPTIYPILGSKYANNADICVNISYAKGNKYIYIYLDLIGIIKFKTSVNLQDEE